MNYKKADAFEFMSKNLIKEGRDLKSVSRKVLLTHQHLHIVVSLDTFLLALAYN